MKSSAARIVQSSLLEDIEAFLEETGMSASRFGSRAMGDPMFVRDLRGGRDVLFATEDKARTQMALFRTRRHFLEPSAWPVRRVLRARRAAHQTGG